MKRILTFIMICLLLQGLSIILIGISHIRFYNKIVWEEQALDFNMKLPCNDTVQTCVMVGKITK